MKGKSTRIGVYKCYQCRKPFRAAVGTVFEASHVPLRLWLRAPDGVKQEGHQLQPTGVTLKNAWFMSHRVREAMRTLGLEPIGGAGQVVEIDETAEGRIEGSPKRAHRRMGSYGRTVLTLVE
jgi:hypothetical protein